MSGVALCCTQGTQRDELDQALAGIAVTGQERPDSAPVPRRCRAGAAPGPKAAQPSVIVSVFEAGAPLPPTVVSVYVCWPAPHPNGTS